jgi:hypothetical protein
MSDYDDGFEKIYQTKEEFEAALNEIVEQYHQNRIMDEKEKKLKPEIKQRKIESPPFCSDNEAKTMLETTLKQYGKTFFVKGKIEGKTEGKEEGIQKGKVETLILLLEERFGCLSLKQKEMICQFNEGDFTQAFKRLFSIQRLDDIFTVDD